MLYAKVSQMEDQVLEFLEAKEVAEADVAALKDELARTAAEKDALADAIKEQWRLIDKELAVKEERKKSTAELIDEYLMEIYDRMREAGNGRVVGRLIDDTCGACHLKLSAAEIARVHTEDPPRCIHCRSILVG
jgi:predicted  nucleic acid-binding Zn-ribbon protein